MGNNHDYNTPSSGTADWHVPLNANFEQLDRDVEVRDVESSLDEYDPVDGAKFLATDTGRVFHGVGDTWEQLGSVDQAVRIARTADEIQPAIDELSAEVTNASGPDLRGGVVQLLPKAYYPTDTIRLKRGVVVQGTTANPEKWANRRNESDEVAGTTLFTSALPTGSGYALEPADGAHTYRHFDTVGDHRDFDQGEIESDAELRAVTHPHLPVFVWRNQMPIHTDRPPTKEEKREWGTLAGIRNLLLFADEQRYWDPSSEPSGSKARKEATYFGVYDAFLMENVAKTLVQHVATANFLGYNGFYQDAVDVSSIGNHYGANGVGTATDHHGSTLTLDYSFRDYVKRGMWNVDVTGPTPTVKGSGHLTERFVGDGPVKGKIEGKPPAFLGSESAYDAGEAPIVDPTKKNVVFNHVDQHTELWDYEIRGHDNAVGTLVHVDDNNFRAFDTTFHTGKRGLELSVSSTWLRDCRLGNFTEHGIHMGNHTPHLVEGTEIRGRDGSVALYACNRTNGHGGFHGCSFGGDTVFEADNGAPYTFANDCSFRGANAMFANADTEWRGKLQIGTPYGYTNENGGRVTRSGDGSTTTFAIEHGIEETPATYSVDPASPDATGPAYVDADGSTLTITFDTAPPGGTDNLAFAWRAHGWSSPLVANVDR